MSAGLTSLPLSLSWTTVHAIWFRTWGLSISAVIFVIASAAPLEPVMINNWDRIRRMGSIMESSLFFFAMLSIVSSRRLSASSVLSCCSRRPSFACITCISCFAWNVAANALRSQSPSNTCSITLSRLSMGWPIHSILPVLPTKKAVGMPFCPAARI